MPRPLPSLVPLPALAPEPDPAIAHTLASLLAARPTGSICPSEIARALLPPAAGEPRGHEAWRALMPAIHQIAAQARADGTITTSWQGAERPPLPAPIASTPAPRTADR